MDDLSGDTTVGPTQDQHDWATQFTGIATCGSPRPGDLPDSAAAASSSSASDGGGPGGAASDGGAADGNGSDGPTVATQISSSGNDAALGGAPGGPPAGGGSSANPYAGTGLESAWQQGFDDGLAQPAASHEPPAPLSDDAQKVYSEGVLAGQDAANAKPDGKSVPDPAPAQPGPPPATDGPPAPSGSGTPPASGGGTTVNPYAGTDLESAWKQGFDDGSAEPDSSHQPPSPFGDDAARVYAEGVLAGQDAVRPKTDNGPNQSTPRSADDKLSTAAGTNVQIENISASATIPAGTVLYSDSERTISTQEATTITLGVTSGGINATFSPNIKLDQGATIIITAIHYSFSTQTADVQYDANTVLDWWFDIGPKLRAAVASTFAEKLPDSMRGPGYDPYQDPDLAQELNKVVGNLMGSGGGGGPSLPKTTAANLHAAVRLVGELRQGPISIDAGAEITLDVDLDGGIPDQLSDAKVRSVRLSISGAAGGANVNTKIFGQDFPMIFVHGVTVRNGGAITMDYEVIDGVIVAAIKYIVAQEAVHEGKPIGNVDLDPRDSMFRKQIDAHIHSDLEPLLRQAVIDHKSAIPDIDLAKALGL